MEFAKLTKWLKENVGVVGRTLPVPLVGGKKIPLVSHVGSNGEWTWTWAKLDEHLAKNPGASTSGGWGLLLDGLCVVDADSAEAVAWLEGLGLAELERCPMQLTAKGRHYLFARPAWADEEGFYDGARQLGRDGPDVDFKTRCGTGTGGLLVVAPTRGKRWADGRAPWDEGVVLEEVPRALVECVARSRCIRKVGAAVASRRMHSAKPAGAPAPEPVRMPNVETLRSLSGADLVVKVLHLLSKTRWDDYAQWRDIATALKNEAGDEYKAEWLRLSRASAKFDAAAAEKLWGTVARADYDGPRVTLGTLKKWAAADDPVGYQAARASTVAPLVLAKYGERDRGLAEIAHHLLKDVVKRVGTDDGADVFYFDEESCRWLKGKESSVMLRVSYAVEEALRDVEAYLGAKASSTSDDAARSKLDAERKQVAQSIGFMRKRSGMKSVTSLMVMMCQDDAFEQQLDSKPHLLGVRNGVVDLRTGVLRRRVPEDMILTVLDVDYDADASTLLISDTVLSIMADDPEMAAYMQKLLGYAMTGEISEEIFVVFTAGGRNGKGLLMQALADLLGKTFYVEMNCSVIVNRQVANIDAERGKLHGARVAVFNELSQGEKLKASEVQQLTGGDGIPATPKYRHPMTITPRFLMVLCTNHMPELADVVTAMVERMMVVPFPVTFCDMAEGEAPTPTRRQRDNELKGKLKADSAGLLRWLVAGAVAWYGSKDLKRNAPAKVKEFSRQYFDEQDRLATFIRERCTVAPELFVPTCDFAAEFSRWCDDGAPPQDARRLTPAMKNKGFVAKPRRVARSGVTRCYFGLSVAAEVGGGGSSDSE